MYFDTSPRGTLLHRVHALILLAALALAACGDRIIVGREPANLASAESESALDAGAASPAPGTAPDDETADDGGDDEDSDGDEDGNEPDDDDDDESDGDDDDDDESP